MYMLLNGAEVFFKNRTLIATATTTISTNNTLKNFLKKLDVLLGLAIK
jgi:hypothetical protein